jgi:ribosome-associated toxin RatA of RatAB toxin-antitoxin module
LRFERSGQGSVPEVLVLLVRTTLALSLVLLASVSEKGARADAYAPKPTDPQAVELHKLGKEKHVAIATALGKKFKTGHAEIFVNAPVSSVRASVQDYANYQAVIPKFQKAKVLKKNGATTDVYLQIPILHGAATVWTVQHFESPATKGALEWIDGTSVQGNVDALRTRWTYRAVDEGHTILTAEIYVEPRLPGIPVPNDAIGHEAEKAASEAVVSVKAHAEGSLSGGKKLAGGKP